ncbi:IgGFc-binding protein-like [Ranitomeya imitator]|uniref:IgGFc-binding protein-like n=1 Tax=Ranitomeya imitator TaxID=111125 RepID=UPI0037E75528
MNNSDNKKEVTVRKGEPVTFEYPNPQPVIGSGISSSSMIIKANDDITVMSYNFAGTSGDVALHYPVDQWGTKYTIFTPTDGPSKHYAQFAVAAHNSLTTITMVFSGTVHYNGKIYNKGDTMTVDLKPFHFVQLQSTDDLSGTTVTSQHPVAVLSGHSCVPGVGGCSLVYEQLLPEKKWGKSYIVSAPSFSSSDSQVSVLASKHTYLEYQSGEQKLTTNLEAGKPMKIKVSASKPLSIHSTENIQAFLYGFSGNFEGKPFGSFLIKIPDTESFFHNYSFVGQKGFDNNLAIITAKASSVPGFLFNGKPLQNVEWKAIPNTEYVSAEINYGGGFSSNTMQNPIEPFLLITTGYSGDMAYGTVGAGIQAPVCPLLDSIEIIKILRHLYRREKKSVYSNQLPSHNPLYVADLLFWKKVIKENPNGKQMSVQSVLMHRFCADKLHLIIRDTVIPGRDQDIGGKLSPEINSAQKSEGLL